MTRLEFSRLVGGHREELVGGPVGSMSERICAENSSLLMSGIPLVWSSSWRTVTPSTMVRRGGTGRRER